MVIVRFSNVTYSGVNRIKPIEERYIDIEKGYYVKIPKELIGKITIPDQQKNQILKSFWIQEQIKYGLKFIFLSGKNGSI